MLYQIGLLFSNIRTMTKLCKYILCIALSFISISVSATAIDAAMFPLKFNITSDSTVEVSADSLYRDFKSYAIPELVLIKGNQYTVTRIAAHAFEGCAEMERMDFPWSITKIDSFAFAECSKLSFIGLPYDITSIGKA